MRVVAAGKTATLLATVGPLAGGFGGHPVAVRRAVRPAAAPSARQERWQSRGPDRLPASTDGRVPRGRLRGFHDPDLGSCTTPPQVSFTAAGQMGSLMTVAPPRCYGWARWLNGRRQDPDLRKQQGVRIGRVVRPGTGGFRTTGSMAGQVRQASDALGRWSGPRRRRRRPACRSRLRGAV